MFCTNLQKITIMQPKVSALEIFGTTETFPKLLFTRIVATNRLFHFEGKLPARDICELITCMVGFKQYDSIKNLVSY